MIEITAESVRRFPKNGLTDPIEYYRKPLVGWLFRERINLGLRLLGEKHFSRGLEVGYGAGALLMHLAPIVTELHGIDLDADPISVTRMLDERGSRVHLQRGSVLELPYPSNHFDMIACFSVIEHLRSYPVALSEMARVLSPNGVLLLGMPAVNKLMDAGFRAIGFKGIEDHHVTTPAEVSSQFATAGFTIEERNNLVLPLRRDPGLTLYYNWLLRKRDGQ
jgi:SAM-dependent methyltransferase